MKYLSIGFITAFLLSLATAQDTNSSLSIDTESSDSIDSIDTSNSIDTDSSDSIDTAPTYSPVYDIFQPTFNVTDDCGNGICDEGENCLSCPSDCISGTSGGFECGNGVCEDGETCFTCPQDCMSSETSSDGNELEKGFCCYGGRKNPGMENAVNCDDLRCSRPGLGIECSRKESPFVTYCCGDGVCSGEETYLNCEIDNCAELCGNGICDEKEGENAESCASDCMCNFDGHCDSWESVTSCPLDCTCGNNVCDVDLGENVANCMYDCACNANYQCEPWEDEKYCPRDCGYGKDNDVNDGNDGKDQQYDGSNGMDKGNSDNKNGSANDSSAISDCKGNGEGCAKHKDCCSFACDTNAASPICVG